MEKVRVDKWLWAIRLYKSRTLATEACEAGKVKMDNTSIKASKLVAIGDTIQIRHNHSIKIFKIGKLIDKRVSATIAVTCYEDLSPPEIIDPLLKSVFHKAGGIRDKGAGRPTKRDRRDIDKYSDSDDMDDFFD
ncbi:MAG: RNA-binding S4 domain-containing protein [Bacteroidota bacterium]